MVQTSLAVALGSIFLLLMPYLGGELCESRGQWAYLLIGTAGISVLASCTSRKWYPLFSKAMALTAKTVLSVPRWSWFVFTAALLIRAISVFLMPHGEPLPDASIYEGLALRILRGEGYVWHGKVAYWPPGFPGFLSLIYAIFGHNRDVVRMIHALLGALTCPLIYWYGARSDELAARANSLLLALSPVNIAYCHVLRYEVLACFLLVTANSLLMAGTSLTQQWLVGLGAGLSFGLCGLVRPPTLLIVPVALTTNALLRRKLHHHLDFRIGIWVSLGVTIVVVPWIARTYALTGRVIPISSNGGVNFYIGNSPGATGQYYDPPQLGFQGDEARESAHYFRLGLQWIAADPLAWLRLSLSKALLMIDPLTPDRQWRIDTLNVKRDFTHIERIQVLFDVLVFIVVVVAVARRRLTRDAISTNAVLTCSIFLLLGTLVLAGPRFRFLFLPFAYLLASQVLVSDGQESDT